MDHPDSVRRRSITVVRDAACSALFAKYLFVRIGGD
jgi:hypothetical protein